MGRKTTTQLINQLDIPWGVDESTRRARRTQPVARGRGVMRRRRGCSSVVDTCSILVLRGVVVSGVRRMNEVNARRARLVLGWVIVFGRLYHLGM